MEMCYDGALVMPSNYAVMDEEEMTYVEGGGVPRGLASIGIDAFLCATPIGAVFAPLKYLGKTAAKALIKKYASSIAGILGKVINFLGGMVGSAAANTPVSKILSIVDDSLGSCTSLGGIISLIFDCTDKQGKNGWIGNKGFLFF